jgi:aromatic-L-amino-acid decarboxylase
VNEATLAAANATGRLFMVHTLMGADYTLRFSVGTPTTTEAHVRDAWAVIQAAATEVLAAPPPEGGSPAAAH